MKKIPGWCSPEKALLMMDIIKENKCRCCVEIGVFSGKSLFPIARALQYNGVGTVVAIDAWDPSEATKGFRPSDPNYVWWSQLDYKYFYNQTVACINNNRLERFCAIVKRPSHYAACLFATGTIDFIHMDGNHNEDYSFQDISEYFPKVKDGGYILLNDPNWYSMKRSLVFLLERADLVSPFSPSAPYFLFRKNNKRAKKAHVYFNG